jgi:hypothetical protein
MEFSGKYNGFEILPEAEQQRARCSSWDVAGKPRPLGARLAMLDAP